MATAHFPGVKIKDLVPERGPDRLYNFLTKRYAPDLGETAVVGTLGGRVFARYHIVIDLAAGSMRLGPKRERLEEPPRAEGDDVIVSLDESGGIVWFPVEMADGETGVMGLGTTTYDTRIDEDLCRELGHPAGDVGRVTAETLDLSRYVAFRPSPITEVHSEGVVGITGINMLRHLRVEVDRVNRFMRIRPTTPPDFPEADLSFFRAMVEDQADPIERWLEAHPEERLAPEAADLLLDRRLGALVDDREVLERAVKWLLSTRPEDLRASTSLDLFERFSQAGMTDLAIHAGERGLESARADRDPVAAHKIHGRIGEVHLESGDLKKAWKHLLSAAFKMKDDGLVNLNLGLLYEKQGRWARAFSRYVLAVITEDGAPKALEGLKRVQKNLGEGDSISIDRIERFIEGKVPAYRTADTFKATKKNTKNRVVLAEIFTGAHCRPCIAADLAFDGLLSYFPRKHLAVLEYHLPIPQVEPLMAPVSEHTAATRGVRGTPIAFFDGTRVVSGGGGEEEKEAKYLEYKAVVLERLLEKTDYQLTVKAEVDRRLVKGAVEVKGPSNDDVSVHVMLVEKGVLFPGRNKVVVHHMVVRGALTPGSGGVPYRPDDEKMTIPIARRLSDIRDDLEYRLEEVEQRSGATFSMWPTSVDPRQVSIVAFLRDVRTGEVLQAVQVDPRNTDEETK